MKRPRWPASGACRKVCPWLDESAVALRACRSRWRIPAGDDELRPSARTAPRGKWWRPASKTGRIFLLCGALAVLGGFTYLGLTLRTYLERDARFRIAGAANIQATGLDAK